MTKVLPQAGTDDRQVILTKWIKIYDHLYDFLFSKININYLQGGQDQEELHRPKVENAVGPDPDIGELIKKGDFYTIFFFNYLLQVS